MTLVTVIPATLANSYSAALATSTSAAVATCSPVAVATCSSAALASSSSAAFASFSPAALASSFPAALAAVEPGYAIVGILILVAMSMVGVILVLTHIVGPRRRGPIKDGTYESGVDPISDARRRFNVRFYLVAMLFLLFDVEIVFLIPWAVLTPRLSTPSGEAQVQWAADMVKRGYGSGFLLAEIGLFFLMLLVGYAYEWRRGALRWN